MGFCRVTFTLLCLIAIVGGVCILALQIVTATTRAWISASTPQLTFSFGIFSRTATASMMTLTIVRNAAIISLQAMFVFSVGLGITAVITIAIGSTRRQMCGQGTQCYVRIAEICFVLSALFWLVGIAVFTHFWIKEPESFFQPSLIGASYNYGYGYMLGWLVFFLQAALATLVIFGIHVVVRKQDRQLLDEDDDTNERKKLVGAPESAKHQKGQSEQSLGKTSPVTSEPSTSSLKTEEQKDAMSLATNKTPTSSTN